MTQTHRIISELPNRLEKPNLPNLLVPQLDTVACDSFYPGNHVQCHENFLTTTECRSLISIARRQGTWHGVSVQGNCTDTKGGSRRVNMWSPELASLLWERAVRKGLSFDISGNEFVETDWHIPVEQSKIANIYQKENIFTKWKAIGFSPLLRVMAYEYGSQHYPHYDAPYFHPTGHRTLTSFILYLTPRDDLASLRSGATAFVHDTANDLIPLGKKDYSDWKRQTLVSEIKYSYLPTVGRLLTFPHRMCHAVMPWENKYQDRYIIRGDIIYEPIGTD